MSGKVTTFYSYKGGSGRSMTLANVAWALATNGQKVLCVDWDLEAPGLHRYFHPFLDDPEQKTSTGLIDLVWAGLDADGLDQDRLAEAVQPLELPRRGRARARGRLDLLGAGRQDDDYSARVGGLDWSSYFVRYGGEQQLKILMDWARQRYDHILIDSRTGVADTAGICTTLLPDALAVCFVYNRQSIEGSAAVARSILENRKTREMPQISITFCPSRVEDRSNVETARRYAADRLRDVMLDADPSNMVHRAPSVESWLRRQEVRHYPWCAFEEKLAVFQEAPDTRGSLLDLMHGLASHIHGRPLETQVFERELLDAFWRRAAFDDPRLVELTALAEAPVSAVVSRLFSWIAEADSTLHERSDWLMSLAEVCIERAGAAPELLGHEVAPDLAEAALRLGHRAYGADPLAYRTRLARILNARAAQLEQGGRLDEALSFATQAASLFANPMTRSGRWQHAQALERVAELTYAVQGLERALPFYREAADIYGSTPIFAGTSPNPAIDAMRANRLLAERLLEAGDADEAKGVAARALRRGSRARGIPPGETIAILMAWAEACVARGEVPGDVMIEARRLSRRQLEKPKDIDDFEAGLAAINLRRLINTGRAADALFELDGPLASNPANRAEIRAAALEALNRPGDALQALSDALNAGDLRPTDALVTRLVGLANATPELEALRDRFLHGGERSIAGVIAALVHSFRGTSHSEADIARVLTPTLSGLLSARSPDVERS